MVSSGLYCAHIPSDSNDYHFDCFSRKDHYSTKDFELYNNSRRQLFLQPLLGTIYKEETKQRIHPEK